MTAYLTIVKYPSWLGWAGFFSMAIFRLPLFLNRQLHFYKLLGCGKNGTFDKTPDLQQWGLIVSTTNKNIVSSDDALHNIYGSFITSWWKFFHCKKWTLVMEPVEGHGKWDGKEAFGTLPKTSEFNGAVGVLTRATIRLNRIKNFWANVDGVAKVMTTAPGFITSIGVGEVPWIKQATFSIWKDKQSMKDFSYKMKEHAEVIRKTRKENWYSEEMFVRFKLLHWLGGITEDQTAAVQTILSAKDTITPTVIEA